MVTVLKTMWPPGEQDAPPKGLRLYHGSTELLDAKTLVDYDVKDDDVLGVAFANEGAGLFDERERDQAQHP
jgi:hypothetical protein